MLFLSQYKSGLPYHLETLFLFTSEQVLDTVIPGTAFGLASAISGTVLDLPNQGISTITQKLPAVWLWLWLMILQFCLQNQRHTNSVEEDLINKPWRPIPAKRISQKNVVRLLLCTYALNIVVSWHLDTLPIYIAWTILGTAYNDFGGGDHSGLSRNVFCGALFCCTFSGALSIALGHGHSMTYKAWHWTLMMTFGIIGTTIHTQDFRDEVGDRARGRKTLVLEMGRKTAAWSVVVAVSFWTVYPPLDFFRGAWIAAAVLAVFASCLVTISFQVMSGFETKRDRRMYKVWCLWIGMCCGLPALVNASAGMGVV
jgi:4-hydroxybenzoate polyprenyltransferase